MRYVMLFFFLLIASKAIAPDVHVITIVRTEAVDMYERLLRAVVQVESSGDTLAYNALEDAYGPLQIRPIRLRDYNMRTGKNYSLDDCYRFNVSKEIFLYYAVKIGSDYETIARSWNGSGKMTIEYWGRVKEFL